MGKFGWAHISDTFAKGGDKAIQFASGSSGFQSGSQDFTFDYTNDVVALTGSLEIMSGSSTVYGFSAAQLFGNPTYISVSTTVPSNHHSLLLGPITIDSGVSLTISTDSVVKIKDISDI